MILLGFLFTSCLFQTGYCKSLQHGSNRHSQQSSKRSLLLLAKALEKGWSNKKLFLSISALLQLNTNAKIVPYSPPWFQWGQTETNFLPYPSVLIFHIISTQWKQMLALWFVPTSWSPPPSTNQVMLTVRVGSWSSSLPPLHLITSCSGEVGNIPISFLQWCWQGWAWGAGFLSPHLAESGATQSEDSISVGPSGAVDFHPFPTSVRKD